MKRPALTRRAALQAAAALALPALVGAARASAAVGSLWPQAAQQAIDSAVRLLGSDALQVWHRGELRYTRGQTERPMALYSVRKSLLSMLFGRLAVTRGLALDATLASLDIDDHEPLSAVEKSATLRQLLQARSGVYHPAAYETAAMKTHRPARGSHAPGAHWYYNNWDFNALGTIYQRLAGRNLFEAFDAELAGPLGLQDWRRAEHARFHLERASQHPAYLFELSARDLARIGQLMAGSGRWQGQSLLEEGWIADSTRSHSSVGAGWVGYGYLWWTPERAAPFWTRRTGDVFYAHGNYGQFLWIDRARDLVLAHLTDHRRWFRDAPDLPQFLPLLQAVFDAAELRA